MLLGFCVGLLTVGKFELRLRIDGLRTLAVVAIVFGSQATIYALRDRQHLWGLRPSVWLVSSSVADVLIISTLAIFGIAMSPLPIWVVAGEFAAAIVFGVLLELIKIRVFAWLRIA